jgi:molybdopterin synthase sulfur carrier subunit
MIKILFFAYLRERLDLAQIDYELTSEKTVADILKELTAKGEPWNILAEQDVLIAVNQTLSSKSESIKDGDELAFFPPVTGG